MTSTQVYKKALKIWGFQAQAIKAQEEMGELIQAISKFLLKQKGKTNLAEEMADVEIMVHQLKVSLNLGASVQKWKVIKIKRMTKRLMKSEHVPMRKNVKN